MLLNCGFGEDSCEALGLQGDPTFHPKGDQSWSPFHWKDWYWSWNSNILAPWWVELTHLQRPWCWERLRAGEEEDNRGWDGWMASLTQWTWVWIKVRQLVVEEEAWHAVVHGVTKSRTRLSDWTELNWTLYYRLDGLNNRNFFSQFWRLGYPRSK